MAMSNRELLNNIGRIPRLVFHIARVGQKGQKQRVKDYERELHRRQHEMLAAGHDALLKELLAIKLAPQANADSAKLQALQEKYAKLLAAPPTH